MENEFDKFLKEITENKDDSVLSDPIETTEKVETEVAEAPEEGEEVRKNRRHRRLESQLEQEREARIALEARLEALGTTKVRESSDVPSEWTEMYGDTPEAVKAWKLNEKLIENAKQSAKEEAIQEFESRQTKAQEEQKRFESVIDSKLEEIEDEHNVDLTSDSPAARKARREFLEMVQTLSPKDDKGTITGYADFKATYELYKANKVKTSESTNKAKELAARSMESSSGVDVSKETQDAELRELRRLGIRV